MAKIINTEDLEKWLNDRTKELGQDKGKQLACWFASRNALRVLPLALLEEDTKNNKSIFWCSIMAHLAGYNRSFARSASRAASASASASAFRAASASASDAASASASRAASASASASDAASASAFAFAAASASASRSASRSASASASASRSAAAAAAASASAYAISDTVHNDIKHIIEKNNNIQDVNLPLWHDSPNPFDAEWQAAKAKLQQDNDYDFLIDFYERDLAGKSQDWAILEALGTEAAIQAWKSYDLTQINNIIQDVKNKRAAEQEQLEDLKLEDLKSRTPMAAEMRLNDHSGLIKEYNLVPEDSNLLDYAADEAKEALATIQDLNNNFSQGLLKPIKNKLQRALDQRHKAGRLYSMAVRSREQLLLLWQKNDMGDPYQDPDIISIIKHFDSIIASLLAHEVIKEIAITNLDLKKLQNSEMFGLILKAMDKMSNASEVELAQEITEDKDTLQDPEQDEAAKQDAAYFTIARIVRVATLVSNKSYDLLITSGKAATSLILLQKFIASPWGQGLIDKINQLIALVK